MPGDGEILVRNIYLMVAPTNRVWMSQIDQYMEPVAIGDVMRGGTMGVVVESRHADFKPGDIVEGGMAWEEYSVAKSARRIPMEHGLPLSAYASVLGNSGMTAYFGMLDVARPKAGDTIVVSAAAGGVGSIAGQIGKILGCRVVGIAGGESKCRLVVEEFGLDACVDYKQGNLLARSWRSVPGWDRRRFRERRRGHDGCSADAHQPGRPHRAVRDDFDLQRKR